MGLNFRFLHEDQKGVILSRKRKFNSHYIKQNRKEKVKDHEKLIYSSKILFFVSSKGFAGRLSFR